MIFLPPSRYVEWYNTIIFFFKFRYEALLSLLSFLQDVKKAILDDITMKGNEGKLNSFEQVSPFQSINQSINLYL